MTAQSRGSSSPTVTVTSLPQTSAKPHASRGLGSRPRAPLLASARSTVLPCLRRCSAPGPGWGRGMGGQALPSHWHTWWGAGQAPAHVGTGAAIKAGSCKSDNDRAPAQCSLGCHQIPFVPQRVPVSS